MLGPYYIIMDKAGEMKTPFPKGKLLLMSHISSKCCWRLLLRYYQNWC